MIKSAFFATTDTTDIVLFAQKLIQSGYAISALESNYQLFKSAGLQATCADESALSTTQADLIVANLFGHKNPITLESNSAQSAQVAALIRIGAQDKIVLTRNKEFQQREEEYTLKDFRARAPGKSA